MITAATTFVSLLVISLVAIGNLDPAGTMGVWGIRGSTEQVCGALHHTCVAVPSR